MRSVIAISLRVEADLAPCIPIALSTPWMLRSRYVLLSALELTVVDNVWLPSPKSELIWQEATSSDALGLSDVGQPTSHCYS